MDGPSPKICWSSMIPEGRGTQARNSNFRRLLIKTSTYLWSRYICLSVCWTEFMMGRYQKFDGVPYQKYCATRWLGRRLKVGIRTKSKVVAGQSWSHAVEADQSGGLSLALKGVLFQSLMAGLTVSLILEPMPITFWSMSNFLHLDLDLQQCWPLKEDILAPVRL